MIRGVQLLVAQLERRGQAELANVLGLTRANVSNHLGCLRGCGLVVAEAEGRRVRYELADRRVANALRELLDIVLATNADVCPAGDDVCC